MTGFKVFLSMASGEFEPLRNKLAADLNAKKLTVKWQEAFRQEPGVHSLLQLLHDYIRDCDAVVCVWGDRSGSVPPQADVDRYPDVVAAELAQASYTQWEYFFARKYNKRVSYYIGQPGARRDPPSGEDVPDLQAAFLTHVRAQNLHLTIADSIDGLRAEILKEPWPDHRTATHIHLPYPSLGPLFKGRDAFLSSIHDSLTQGTGTAITAAIHGMGGVGKTRAAVEYAWAHHPTLSAALLIPARTQAGLTTALAELTAPLGLPAAQDDAARAAAVLAWLNDHPGWLLILDNADTQEAMQAATALMGRLHGGHVLLTTRLTTLPGAFRRLPLDVLPQQAAADLLLDASVGRRPAPDDRAQALLLAEALGGLALALTHAAAYVATRGLSLERYRGLLVTAFDRLVGYSAPTVTQYERSTAATLALSVAQLTDAGRALLERLAFLAHAPVPDVLLDVPVPDLAEEDLTEALADLAAYSLVTRDLEAGTFTVHRLVREIIHRALPPDAAQARLIQALGWVNAAFTGDPEEVRTWPRLDPLAEHAEAVALAARDAGIADPTARLMGALDVLFHVKARYDRAERMSRGALALTEASRGTDHPDLAVRLANLAALLQATNRLGEAEPLMRRALAIFEASYGAEHPNVAIHLNNLAQLLQDTNRLGEAEPLMRRALVVVEAGYGAEHPNVSVCLNNLAVLIETLYGPTDAEPMYRRALLIDEASYGPDHPSVAIRLNNLADTLKATNRLGEAEPLMRRMVVIFLKFQRATGHPHPHREAVLANHAHLLRAMGHDEASIAAEQQAMHREAGLA